MSAADWPIVREVAIVFGLIMRGIFVLLSSFDVYSIPLCIITFVIISKLLILPSTYKRQKFSVLAPKLVEKTMEIQKKYEKRLEHPLTQNKMNVDKGFLLTKYGVFNSSNMAMTLLQLPVLFALYAIVQDMPRFVPEMANLTEAQLLSANTLFGISINDVPGFNISILILFPIITAVLHLIEMYQSSAMNRTVNNGKLVGGISNAMMIAMMFYFSTQFPIVCSLYWIARGATDIVIIFFIQRYVKTKDLDFFYNQQLKKINRSRKKRGLEALTVMY